jgi:uncharacterized protein YcbK (DUF882 family)
VAKYFSPDEMRCRDGTPYPETWAVRLGVLFQALDTIREAWGGPLVIVSGYRSLEHNAKVDGAKSSQHVMGRAVDLRPVVPKVDGVRKPLQASDIHALHKVVNNLLAEGMLPAVGGVGVYPFVKQGDLLVPGWVHVDTRPRPESGHIARWEGAKFGDEQAV